MSLAQWTKTVYRHEMAQRQILEWAKAKGETGECRYDHHGYCQTHFLHEKPCPFGVLVETAAELGEPIPGISLPQYAPGIRVVYSPPGNSCSNVDCLGVLMDGNRYHVHVEGEYPESENEQETQ